VVETKNNDATTRAQKMRRGNETGCVDKSRGGLFDIVKKDGGCAGRASAGDAQRVTTVVAEGRPRSAFA
jgi:hypothetical protein